jgi:hypothetical protein
MLTPHPTPQVDDARARHPPVLYNNPAAATLSETPWGESNEPNTPNNEAFLGVVFQGMPEAVWPVVVSFMGNPNTVAKSAWAGQGWQTELNIPENYNAYFSLSVYTPGPDGSIRRKKEYFKGLYAIVLDDVGTKVPMDRVILPPSWKLETSHSNFQFGYLLKEPITDVVKADRLMEAIIAAGLCDSGAGGPASRIMRLPVGINGKNEPNFICKMKEWAPDRRYSPEQILEGYQLDLEVNTKTNKTATGGDKQRERDEVFQPAPGENLVLVRLKSLSLYKQDLGNGKHDITCPWCHEHTNEEDRGTGYYEPNANFPLGGFHCFHSHGEGLSIRYLLEFLGVSPAAARMKPSIRVMPGQLHQIVPFAEKVLADTGR